MEPWSIILVAIALTVSLWQFNEDRKVREAMMRSFVAERLDATRERQWDTERRTNQRLAESRTGQVRLLEIMAGMRFGLSGMDLSGINLSRIQFQKAYLMDADLACADLGRANLNGSNLENADLSWSDLFRAEIAGANFTNADLSGAKIGWTKFADDVNFTGAKFNHTEIKRIDLRSAVGLTNEQVNAACGEIVDLPAHITVELQACSEDDEEEQECSLRTSNFYRRLESLAKDVSEIKGHLDP